jgi:hypothetical protein
VPTLWREGSPVDTDIIDLDWDVDLDVDPDVELSRDSRVRCWRDNGCLQFDAIRTRF